MTAILRFDDVHRHFGGQQVLRGLSLQVEPGQIYAFLGRNGAGKTTALRILLGFLEPHRGQASLLGVDSRALRPADRARIGYVGEGHRLDPTLRIGETLQFEAGTRPGFRTAFAEAALQRCGLRNGQYVARLSRGQRAQLSLILAVGANPDVLVFDDPAMGLDVVMRREFLDAMIDLLAESGCGVLFSSHILTDVERIADRVGILHGGALLVDATMDDLKRRVRLCAVQGVDAAAVAADPRILRVLPRRDGVELLLLDAEGREAIGGAMGPMVRGGKVGEPTVPTLEELFVALTGPDRPGLLTPPVTEARVTEVAS